jgi:hypothetical protein
MLSPVVEPAADQPARPAMTEQNNGGSGTAAGLIRITVNLTPRAKRDLETLTATGINRTDVVNRAIRLLALLNEHLEDGTLTIRQPDGRYDRVFIL